MSSVWNLHENSDCILCGTAVLNSRDRYFIKSDGSTVVSQIVLRLPENLRALIAQPQPQDPTTRQFCCRQCKLLLEKWQKNVESVSKTEAEIVRRSREKKSKCSKELFKEISAVQSSTPRASRDFAQSDVQALDFSPISSQSQPGTCTSTTCSSYSVSNTSKSTNLGVKIVVSWPSQQRQRKLRDCLEPLGKAMLRGTWSDIARATFKVKEIKAELLKCFVKDISNECAALTSTKKPSVLRNVTTQGIRDLTMSKINHELRERAPIFYSMLVSSALSSRSRRSAQDLIPGVAVAGAVLLKERCSRINGLQLMITTIMKYTGFQSMCAFLSTLKVGVTASYFNKKCDELGSTFDERLQIDKKKDKEALEMQHSACGDPENAIFGPGWKIVFDNFDIYQRVRDMTEQNQNKDLHWVNHIKVSNRISGNDLPDDKSILEYPAQLDNSKCVPSVLEHIKQRSNYINLIARVLVEEIPCLESYNDSIVYHIPHKHSAETATKSEKECLGMIFQNENKTEGITEVLKTMHTYVPEWTSEGGATHFVETGLVGDQLSVERAVNCILSLSNGFTAQERLEGLHLEIADWHAELKFLDLIYNRFYSTISANDMATLFAERNLINRRNVKADTHHSYAANKQMFLLSVKSRIVVAAMDILGMESLDGKPTTINCFPHNTAKDIDNKRRYVNKIAAVILDKWVVDGETYNGIISSILSEEEQERVIQNQMTVDGRFPCRHPGCDKTFKHNGQHRRNHEAQAHGLIVEDPQPESGLESSKSTEKREEVKADDMYNYQCNFLEHGLLYMNFTDAIAEGDGDRIIQCWKFLLLHFYADKGSTKYALEALFIQFQQQALLTPRQAYRQRWNRSVNNQGRKGKNVPLDLDLEHNNNILKEALRKMGSNLSLHAVNRAAKMVKIATETIDKVAKECHVMKRSGKHFVQSTKRDMEKIVQTLKQQNALVYTHGRCYQHYTGFKRSHLTDRIGGLCKWINKHKYNMEMYVKAR